MQPSAADKPAKGFTQIPNALIDNPNLCIRDKMALIKLQRHAYGEKKTVHPSKTGIAKALDIRWETAKAALDSLTALGVIRPHGKGRPGKQETYTLDLDRAANLSAESIANLSSESIAPIESVDTKHTAEENELNNTLAPRSTSIVHGSVESAEGEDMGSCSAYEGPIESVVRFTKRQINEWYLTPDGKRVNGDPDDLSYDLNSLCLPMLGSKHIPEAEMDKLIELRGVKFCQLWEAWLPRKIAWYYDVKHEAVENLAGLYRRAVEQHWEVSPSWPEYDEHKHRKLTTDELYDDAIPF